MKLEDAGLFETMLTDICSSFVFFFILDVVFDVALMKWIDHSLCQRTQRHRFFFNFTSFIYFCPVSVSTNLFPLSCNFLYLEIQKARTKDWLVKMLFLHLHKPLICSCLSSFLMLHSSIRMQFMFGIQLCWCSCRSAEKTTGKLVDLRIWWTVLPVTATRAAVVVLWSLTSVHHRRLQWPDLYKKREPYSAVCGIWWLLDRTFGCWKTIRVIVKFCDH